MSNPMKDYVLNFRANLPSGVAYDSGVSRYFANGKRFLNEWEAEGYINYIKKFGFSVNPITVAPTASTAPTISGTVAPGETVTLNEGTYTGTTPVTITFTLTLDGADVTADVASNRYTIPTGTAGQSLVYTETANNGTAPDATQSVTETVQAVASGSEMLLTISGDDLVLSNPQELALSGSDLSLATTSSTSATIEAINDQGQVADTAAVSITGPGVLGTVDGLLPGLGSGFYTFRLRTDETAAAYTVPEAPDATTTMMSAVPKDGVTFNLDQQYPVGEYANGDYFVVAPSGGSLLSTSPAAETTDATSTLGGTELLGRDINGLAVNPGGSRNAWDSYDPGTNIEYSPSLNKDPGKTGSAYAFSPGETLVKAVSVTTPLDSARTTIEKFVTLTIVDAPPKEGSFRPPPWGPDKTMPDSWREGAIDWSKVPQIDTGRPDPDWAALGADALVTWQTGTLWGNSARNITPATQPNYRRDIGEKLGEFIQALTAPGTEAEKRDIMIGAIQIGIDQIAAGEIDPNVALDSANNRYDLGRRAVSVMAALLLPDTQRIRDMLAVDWKWQDISSVGYIDQETIDHTDDDTQRGAMDGMQGLPEYASARPGKLANTPSDRPDLMFGAIALQGTAQGGYRKIGLQAEFLGTTAIHMFDGASQLFNAPALVQYNDRWLSLIEAGWPEVGGVDAFGVPTGYTVGTNALRSNPINYIRAVRNLIDVPHVDTLGLNPERPEPPELIENGTQIIVKPVSPYVGYGAAQTQMDIRYIETVQDGTVLYGGNPYPKYVSVGAWTEINDAQPNPNGDFLISPTATGGLADNTRYCVAIRYRSANGIGAWSNNWTFGYEPGSTALRDDPWIEGASTTTVEKSATAPLFNTQPVLDSYFTEGRPIRVGSIDSTGFPVPEISYQWSLDGTPVPGATSDILATSVGDAGKVPSVEITLTNTEGTLSTTVTGTALAVTPGDTGYRPARYEALGNISIYAPAPGTAEPVKEGDLTKATFAFWVGQGENVFQGAFRGRISTQGGSVSIRLDKGGGTAAAEMSFGDFIPDQMAWYLVSIDATNPTVSERIKVWRKPEGSPFPPERLPVTNIATELTDSTFRLARPTTSGSYYQRIYEARGDEEFNVFSDFWHSSSEALVVEDFWNSAGYPYNVDDVGTGDGSGPVPSVGVPRVRTGGSQTEAQFEARENSGSDVSPLPAESPGTPITKTGDIDVGD